MGEEWDRFQKYGHWDGKRGYQAHKDAYGRIQGKCPSKYEVKREMLNYQTWTTAWAREALRVLLPGASMLVMGGTRTYHRMACGVEDAGFEVKDCVLWCYASGFPKAQDLGKLIDRRRDSTKHDEKIEQVRSFLRENLFKFNREEIAEKCGVTARQVDHWIKENESQLQVPSMEKWGILKTLISSLPERPEIPSIEWQKLGKIVAEVENPITWFSGDRKIRESVTPLAREWDGWKVGGLKPSYEPVVWAVKPPEGSTTDNVLKHGVGAINVEACRIPFESEDDIHGKNPHTVHKVEANYGIYSPYENQKFEVNERGRYPANMIRTDRFGDGYDRFYFVPKAERAERWFKCQICNVYQDGAHLRDHSAHALHCHDCGIDFPNTEEEQKAHKSHRTESNIVAHPTVKPVALGEFLIKLVTREGQIVLDPFTGLGSFLVAARNLNRQYIGFDNGPEYIEIAKRRLAAVPERLERWA